MLHFSVLWTLKRIDDKGRVKKYGNFNGQTIFEEKNIMAGETLTPFMANANKNSIFFEDIPNSLLTIVLSNKFLHFRIYFLPTSSARR